MIRTISAQEATPLCKAYAKQWNTGDHEADSAASWVGYFVGDRLCGVLGFIDDSAYRRRMVLSWHAVAGRFGKIAARELFQWSHDTLEPGWVEIGTVAPHNLPARRYLTKVGCGEAAIIFVRRKEHAN